MARYPENLLEAVPQKHSFTQLLPIYKKNNIHVDNEVHCMKCQPLYTKFSVHVSCNYYGTDLHHPVYITVEFCLHSL